MTTSKYDLRLNPPYMVDFAVMASGKRMGATKKKVQWKFGFSNAKALADGLTGTDCRGEEHEVNLAWSLMSGKRTVTFDGKEIHYSMGSRTDTQFDTSFTIRGGHTVKLVAHAALPMREIPGFRQYDLSIDGMSVFQMPKIYELGTGRVPPLGRAPARRLGRQEPVYGYPPENTYENAWAGQPVEHYDSSARSVPRTIEPAPQQRYQAPPEPAAPPAAPSPPPVPAVDLIAAPVATNDYLATPPVDVIPTHAPPPTAPGAPYAPPPTTTYAPPTTAYAPPVVDEFAPVVPVQTYGNKMNDIMAQYGPSPSTPSKPGMLALTNGQDYAPTPNTAMSTPMAATPGGYNVAPPPRPEHQFFAESRNTDSPVPSYEQEPLEPVRLSMNEPSPTTVVRTMGEERQNDLQKAVTSLVNLDDITEPAPEQYNKLSLKEEKERQVNGRKSKPLPPQTSYLGSGATLSDIQSHTAQHKAPPKQDVMRANTAFDPNAAQAGMMVVYGQEPMSFNQGFGAGLSTHDAFGRPFAAH